MVTRYVALRPLPGWIRRERGEIAIDLGIRSLRTEELPNVDLWNEFLSGEQITRLRDAPAWLVHENLDEAGIDSRTGQHADQRLGDAGIALAAVAPIDVPLHVTIMCERQGERTLRPISIIPHASLTSVGWARVAGYDGASWEQIRRIADNVEKASARNITRIINPLRFLEHGLASNEPHVRLLLFVVGIDALLMANTLPQFETRICNLLGPDTLIFPEIRVTGFGQPRYKIADLAKDMFEFRSVIAHGRRIPPKYWRDPLIFESVDKTRIACYHNINTYRDLLHESSLFVLCMALRAALSGPVERVENTARWRELLEKPRQKWSG